MLNQNQLKSLLSYDPETGYFTWIMGRRFGKIAGSANNQGYLVIRINKKLCKAHRLAWLYVYGAISIFDIDHINGNKIDNRIVNLRECTATQNKWNVGIRKGNKSGFKGVSWSERDDKWRAQISSRSKSKHIGYYATAELASAAYNAKAMELHGNFYRET